MLGEVIVDGDRDCAPGAVERRELGGGRRIRGDVGDGRAAACHQRLADAAEPLRTRSADCLYKRWCEPCTGRRAQHAVVEKEEADRAEMHVLFDQQPEPRQHQLERRGARDQLEDLGLCLLQALAPALCGDVPAHQHDCLEGRVVEQVRRSELEPCPAPGAVARTEVADDGHPWHAQQEFERLLRVVDLVGVGEVEDRSVLPVRRRPTQQRLEMPEVREHEALRITHGDDVVDVLEQLLVAFSSGELGVGDVTQLVGQIFDEPDEIPVTGEHAHADPPQRAVG